MDQFYAAVRLNAEGENPYETLYHEYYHSLTLPYFPMIPVWLAEGLAEFFGNTHITDKEALTGEPSGGLIAELKQNRLIPLDVLFKVDHSSPYYNEQNKTSEFYAESWALTHYFMLADKGTHRQLLSNYLSVLGQGATEQEAAAKAFGDLESLQRTLQQYVGNYQFYDLKVPAPSSIPDSDLHALECFPKPTSTPIRAGLKRCAGTRRKQSRRLEMWCGSIRSFLSHIRISRSRNCLTGNETKRSRTSHRRLRSIQGTRRLATFGAYLTLTGGREVPGDTQVEDDLRQSIATGPDFAPPYGMLANYLALRQEGLPEALSLAKKAISLEPGTSTYWIDLAQVLGQMHRYDDAKIAALQARANSIGPEQQARADTVLTVLQTVQSMQTNDARVPARASTDEIEPQHRPQPDSTAKTGTVKTAPAPRTTAK